MHEPICTCDTVSIYRLSSNKVNRENLLHRKPKPWTGESKKSAFGTRGMSISWRRLCRCVSRFCARLVLINTFLYRYRYCWSYLYIERCGVFAGIVHTSHNAWMHGTKFAIVTHRKSEKVFWFPCNNPLPQNFARVKVYTLHCVCVYVCARLFCKMFRW